MPQKNLYSNKPKPHEMQNYDDNGVVTPKQYTWNFINKVLNIIPNAKYYNIVKLDTKFSSGKDKYVTIFTDEDDKVISYHLTLMCIDRNEEEYFRCTEESIKSLNYFKNKDREILEDAIANQV